MVEHAKVKVCAAHVALARLAPFRLAAQILQRAFAKSNRVSLTLPSNFNDLLGNHISKWMSVVR
jgi:hypothetical protein